MRKIALILIATCLIAGCGARQELTPKAGKSMPIKARAAPAAPTVDELLKPTEQANPKRSDEPLRRSEERQDDKFDLPPSER